MVQSLDATVHDATNDTSNDPGMCLQQTRIWAEIPAKYGDATDAWHATKLYIHKDANPPRGAFVYWTGGSSGHGHIALSLGDKKIRSTDAGGSGKVATVDLHWPETHWGLVYGGSSCECNDQRMAELVDYYQNGGSSTSTQHGMDVSHWQTGISIASSGQQFVIAKATEGTGYVDPECDHFYASAKNAGIERGVYHFWDGGSPSSEADHFLDIIRKRGYVGDAVLALDWESGNLGDVDAAKAWLDRVQAHTGVKPVIYMSGSVVTGHNWSKVADAGYGLWIARWGDDYGSTGAWNKPTLWQFTDHMDVDGTPVDGDRFYGNKDKWTALAGGDDDMPYKSWPQADKDALTKDVAERVHNKHVQVGSTEEPLGLAVGRTRAVTKDVVTDTADAVADHHVQVGTGVEELGLAVGRTRAATQRIEANQTDAAELARAVIDQLPDHVAVDVNSLADAFARVQAAGEN